MFLDKKSYCRILYGFTNKYNEFLLHPELAQKIINNSDEKIQRNSSKARVLMLSDAISRGFWQFNYVPIIIDIKGNCIDGFHRLKACILSGVSIKVLIICDVETDLINTIDSDSRPRSASAVYKISKKGEVSYIMETTSSAGFIDRYNNGLYSHSTETGVSKSSTPEILRWINDNNFNKFVCDNMPELSESTRLLNASTFLGIKWVILEKQKDSSSKEIVNAFFKDVLHGDGKIKSNVAILRKRLHNAKYGDNVQKLTQMNIVSAIVKTWNACFNDTQIKVLSKLNKVPDIAC